MIVMGSILEVLANIMKDEEYEAVSEGSWDLATRLP